MSEPRTTGELIEAVADLADRVEEFVGRLERVGVELAEQRTRVGVLGRRSTLWTAIVGAAVVLLAGFVFLFSAQLTTRTQLQGVIADQQAQRAEAVCPLIGLFLGYYAPETVTLEEREHYEESFATLRHIYAYALDCSASGG